MLKNIAYFLILGKPLVLYLGIITLILLLLTATMGFLVMKGKANFKHHLLLAKITIALALIHGILGLALYFNL